MNDVMTDETKAETESSEEEDEAGYQAFEDRIDQCYNLLESWTGDAEDYEDGDDAKEAPADTIDDADALGVFAAFLIRLARELEVPRDEFLELLAELWEQQDSSPEPSASETANLS